MRALLLAAWLSALFFAGQSLAVDAFTGTWSPDRRIAVAEKCGDDGTWQCYFRDQYTGENLGEIPLIHPRPADGELAMKAAWNYIGTRLTLLINYSDHLQDLRVFAKDRDGQLRPVNLPLPNPIELYRRQTGRKLLPTPDSFAEAGVGPWTDDDTVMLFLGEARPAHRGSAIRRYAAEFKVHFHGERATVADVRFKMLRAPQRDDEFVTTGWGTVYSLVPWTVYGAERTQDELREGAPERVYVGHNEIAEEAGSCGFLKMALEEYRADFGDYPSGDNRTITRELFGLNSKHKVYEPFQNFNFDRDGNIIDPWNEPYIFGIGAKDADVFSRREKMASDDVETGRQWDCTYDPLYFPTKQDVARGMCYELALAIRLVVQRVELSLPLQKLLHVKDPWGTPYVIKRTADHVSVSSKHLPGEVYTEAFSPVP